MRAALTDVDILGHRIPKDTDIWIMALWSQHRLPRDSIIIYSRHIVCVRPFSAFKNPTLQSRPRRCHSSKFQPGEDSLLEILQQLSA
jgi:hypothetical protein